MPPASLCKLIITIMSQIKVWVLGVLGVQAHKIGAPDHVLLRPDRGTWESASGKQTAAAPYAHPDAAQRHWVSEQLQTGAGVRKLRH